MSSPFDKKKATAAPRGGTATKAKADDGLPDPTNIGEDKPISDDPFAASDPSGISGWKALHFLGQLVLMHPTETGEMKTSSNTPENPLSEFVRFDFIPITVPDVPEVIDNFGEVEAFEPYEVGERIEDVLVFNRPLVREGKRALDKGISWIIGRIERGAKKQGQSRPLILVQATEEDKALYAEWRKSIA